MANRGEVENRDSLDNHSTPTAGTRPAEAAQPFTTQELGAALDRVLHREVFRFSESLRTLLAYVGEKSVKHEGEALKEYTIGVELRVEYPTVSAWEVGRNAPAGPARLLLARELDLEESEIDRWFRKQDSPQNVTAA